MIFKHVVTYWSWGLTFLLDPKVGLHSGLAVP